MTLALSCEVVHEKLWKSVNICKSYSKKNQWHFFSWTRCSYGTCGSDFNISALLLGGSSMWTLLLASTVSLPYRHWRVTGTLAPMQ